MASINKKCFEKKCLCATCDSVCSRCFIDDDGCKPGIESCDRYNKLDYEKYIGIYYYSKVDKELYEKGNK